MNLLFDNVGGVQKLW